MIIHHDLRDVREQGGSTHDSEDAHRHRLVRSEDVEGREVTFIPDVKRFRTLPNEELQPSC